MTLNFWSSCFCHPRVTIPGVWYHTWFIRCLGFYRKVLLVRGTHSTNWTSPRALCLFLKICFLIKIELATFPPPFHPSIPFTYLLLDPCHIPPQVDSLFFITIVPYIKMCMYVYVYVCVHKHIIITCWVHFRCLCVSGFKADSSALGNQRRGHIPGRG